MSTARTTQNGPPSGEPLPLFDRIRAALLEDAGPLSGVQDLTSRALIPEGIKAEAVVVAKSSGLLCGAKLFPLILQMAEELGCEQVQARAEALHHAEDEARAGEQSWKVVEELAQEAQQKAVQVQILIKEGERVRPGSEAIRISGGARAILFGERTALNLLGHLSGIATQTARYVEAVAGTRAKVVDTRKTTPLWRDLEKYAVKCGGGVNHRKGLYDLILIKDNHLALWGQSDPAGAVRAAQARYPGVGVQVEVTDLVGLAQVCRHSRPDLVLLDNFSVERVREAVGWCDEYYRRLDGRPQLEASGGITLQSIRGYAEAGVERISVGALTHAVKSLDFSLEVRKA